ncbi:MAG: hypothetical protein KGH70_02465 [Rhodospirillales bacterium]|nr:hypothetical protein [Rhodospirillales bacterium]
MTTRQIGLMDGDGMIVSAALEIVRGPGTTLKLSSQTTGSIEATASDMFEALCQLRLHLQSAGCKILCQGARLNVFPSRMTRQMGDGTSAYQLTMGHPATFEDLVNIFDPTEAADTASVKEQADYYQAWLKSLTKTGNGANPDLTPALVEEARRTPNGWVYKIDGHFKADEPVPPEAIMGAWKVNATGEIEGEFIPNGNYKPKLLRDLINTKTFRKNNDK